METTIYSDGTYLRNNPDWHADDSAWKAGHIATMLARHGIAPRTVCEVGCGAGEILCTLSRLLDPETRFTGYEISPEAFGLCAPKSTARVSFRFGNLLDSDEHFDVVLAIDVFEHVEDYFGFLRALRPRGEHKIFHIPLELSALQVMRAAPLIEARRSVGHIHHFSKETALATLEDCGYEVIDHCYTSGRTELGGLGWKSQLLKGPREAMFAASPDTAARLLGGYSLLVLAR
ncbi:MAG TPA: class I SAM-dependent methyltransferase [Usitatibacter sp.]|nr:class I SAM-dependent methyltransferase [Usitatibacter sp.]